MIGATGLVGHAIVQQLVNTDYIDKVITLTRRPSPHSSTKVINQVVDFDHLDNYISHFDGNFYSHVRGQQLSKPVQSMVNVK
ncbi:MULTISPECIES: hypothetical protein [unclassified Colwellia]|uniref:hypothetical protein n=1 Tax=unclassified Colwellia TaxID=196834 RepID=UPI00286FDF9F|nr:MULTISPECIES: hypothetical protein [unclassified Colwellia]